MPTRLPFIYYFFSIFTLLVLVLNFRQIPHNQTAATAQAWLNGKLYLADRAYKVDTVEFKGHAYWTLGPFPSVLLIPIVFLTQNITYAQNILNILLVTLTTTLLFKISKLKGFSTVNALWLTLAFLGGSVFSQAAFYPKSWNLAHTVTVTITLLALYENFNKNRTIIIGVLMASLLATRPTAFLATIYFVLEIITSENTQYKKLKQMCLLLTPIILSAILLAIYNYLRFSNISTTGYLELANREYFPLLKTAYPDQKFYGLFSVAYIWRNFVTYFLILFRKGVLSFDISAIMLCLPFVYIFKKSNKNRSIINAIATSLCILVVILSYYWAGWGQIGPRYLNDLLPFLFLILINNLNSQKLPKLFKFFVVYSTTLNTVLVLWLVAKV